MIAPIFVFVRRFAMVAVAAAVLTAGLNAQSAVDGAIAGTVTDASGATVPNARISIHDKATGATTAATADASGFFRVPRLVPDHYTVTVSAAGFTDYAAKDVIVEVGAITTVTPKLDVAGHAEIIEVTAEAPALNTESADFSTEFNPTALNTLPINGRHWTSFALLSPGVTLGNSAFGQVTFRGATNLQNNFLVDGSDDNESFQSIERGYTRVGYSTSQEAILEFQVLTSNVSAQYGRAVGGGVNAITRSGSNTWHGDAFWDYRDNDFGATNPFNILQTYPTTVLVKPKDKRHQFGGAFSGPLMHDKLFFFYANDNQRRNFPIVAVPTPQFLAASNAAYNNCTVAGSKATTDAVSCAEARGVTAAQVTAAMNYITGQSGIAPRTGDQGLNFLKFDYRINEANNASLMYNRMRWSSPNGTQTNPVIRRGLTSIGSDWVGVDSVIGKLDTFITPRISNELRLEWARDNEHESGNTPMSNEPTTTAGGLPPGVTITTNSGFNMGTPYYVPRSKYPDEPEADVVDNVSMTLGNHTVNFGGEYRWAQDNIIDVDYLHGLFSYARLADFITDFARYQSGSSIGCDSSNDTGTGTMPCFSTLTQNFGHPQFVFHTNEYAAYIQDDWKILPRLTINLGLRYDYEQLPSPKIPNPAVAQTGVMPSDKTEFAPRLGFAYSLFKDGKTTVRGGFGGYVGRIQNGTIWKALANTGSSLAQFSLATSASNLACGTTANPQTCQYPYIVPTASAPAVSNITAFDSGFKAPMAWETDLSIQREVGFKTVVGVAYLGSFGRRLQTFVDANIAPTTLTRAITFTGGPLNGDTWTVPLYAAGDNSNYPTGRLNSAYNALTLIRSSLSSNYDALSITADHRLSHGVQAQVSYTWSKALDNGMNQSSTSDTNDQSDPFTAQPDYGRSVNDIPHRLVGSLTLAPEFRLKNKTTALLANGWMLVPVWTLQSGIPYSFYLSGGSSLPGGGKTYNGSGGSGASSGQYVDFRAYPNFTSSSNYSANVFPSRNSQRQANILDVSTRLARTVTVAEKYKLMFGAEAFNILNRQNFTAYNTTAYTLSGSGSAMSASYQSTFGTPSAAGNTIYRERQIQFVTRFEF
jgi:hypothetical protein